MRYESLKWFCETIGIDSMLLSRKEINFRTVGGIRIRYPFTVEWSVALHLQDVRCHEGNGHMMGRP